MLDENYSIKFFEQTWAHVKSPYLKPIHAQTLDVGDGETLTLTPWDPGFFKQICYILVFKKAAYPLSSLAYSILYLKQNFILIFYLFKRV